jgi:hypothetical protein
MYSDDLRIVNFGFLSYDHKKQLQISISVLYYVWQYCTMYDYNSHNKLFWFTDK